MFGGKQQRKTHNFRSIELAIGFWNRNRIRCVAWWQTYVNHRCFVLFNLYVCGDGEGWGYWLVCNTFYKTQLVPYTQILGCSVFVFFFYLSQI